MKIGVCLPYMERDYDRERILAWCRMIDEGPFHSLSCGERITGYTFEMRMLLAAAAAVTERVRIVPSLYVLPMHNAVWAAKEIATLDQLSNGRVTVTVGVGGREKDYESVGSSFAKRHQRLDDSVAEMRRIWSGEPAVAGADPVGPDPIQAGGPPILAGAMGPKAIARASHWADGLYGFAMGGEQSLMDYFFDTADKAWQETGRSEAPRRVGGFWLSLADNAEQRLKQYVYDYLLFGGEEGARNTADAMTRFTPDAVNEGLDNMEAAGCEECMLVPATADLSELERVSELLLKRYG